MAQYPVAISKIIYFHPIYTSATEVQKIMHTYVIRHGGDVKPSGAMSEMEIEIETTRGNKSLPKEESQITLTRDHKRKITLQGMVIRAVVQAFSGLIGDLKRRLPYYVSDYKDGSIILFYIRVFYFLL